MQADLRRHLRQTLSVLKAFDEAVCEQYLVTILLYNLLVQGWLDNDYLDPFGEHSSDFPWSRDHIRWEVSLQFHQQMGL